MPIPAVGIGGGLFLALVGLALCNRCSVADMRLICASRGLLCTVYNHVLQGLFIIPLAKSEAILLLGVAVMGFGVFLNMPSVPRSRGVRWEIEADGSVCVVSSRCWPTRRSKAKPYRSDKHQTPPVRLTPPILSNS